MRCRFCNEELPDGASFCPMCAHSLVEKKEVALPSPYRKKISIIIAAAILICAAAAVLVWNLHRPEQYSGEADIRYKDYHLLLRNVSSDTFHWTTPQGTYSRTLAEGTQGAVPLQLYVYDEETEENKAGEFLSLLDHSEITAIPQGNGKTMDCSRPGANESFPKAALVSDIVYTTDCGANEIEWVFTMKNGDTITLREMVEIKTLQEITYTWEQVPLETTEDVQAAINDSKDETVLLTLVLPPDTAYEGNLSIGGSAVCLTGSENTVMHGKISVDTRQPQPASFQNISFEGADSGIEATVPFFAEECSFTESSTAILANNGAWPIVFGCTFKKCIVGIHFNSEEASAKSALYSGDSFIDNEVGVLLEKVPGPTDLHFEQCVFEGNGTDIDNKADIEVVFD